MIVPDNRNTRSGSQPGEVRTPARKPECDEARRRDHVSADRFRVGRRRQCRDEESRSWRGPGGDDRLGPTGNIAEKALESVSITLNKNAIPNDPEKPMVTSGIRVGSAAGTSRGFGVDDYREIATLMLDTLQAVRGRTLDARRLEINSRVRRLVVRFPLPY